MLATSPRSPFLTLSHEAFRRSVRAFIAENVLPFADEWEERRRIPRELWESMGKEGYLGLNLPAEHGGGSPDFFYSVVYLEELGEAGYAGFRGAFLVHSYMALEYLSHAGSDFLKRKYLRPAVEGSKIASLALTERVSGSDTTEKTVWLRLKENLDQKYTKGIVFEVKYVEMGEYVLTWICL